MKVPDVQLFCDEYLVAIVKDVSFSDYTYYGRYQSVLVADNKAKQRLLEFVEFSENWHQRYKDNPSDPPDTSECNLYQDLFEAGRWSVKFPDGKVSTLTIAPSFADNGAITWR